MFATLTIRRFHVFAIALVSAFVAIPAFAYAATSSTTRAELAGLPGYCQSYDTNAPTPAPVGKTQIVTSSASSPGFHAVKIQIKLRANQIAAGSYQVWLVNLYRDDTGQVIGCAASPLSSDMTVKSGRSVDFRGSADRYSGEYELQVYVGPIWGPGYGSSPATVDVP